MTARNHHFVPQCYLRGFLQDRRKPKLFVVDIRKRTSFETAPRNVAAERDFHAIDVEGHASDALESALSSFEGELAGALARIISDRELRDEKDKILLLNLIALLAVKNPRGRRTFMAFEEGIYDLIGDLVTSTDEIWNSQKRRMQEAGYLQDARNVTREQVRDFLNRGEYTLEMSAGHHVGLELDAFNKVLPIFFDRHWSLLRAPSGSCGFVTSDHPVCLYWSNPSKWPALYSPGYGMQGTEVLFPISSGLAFIGTFEHPPRLLDVTEQQVEAFNSTIIAFCDRQVYGRDGDCSYRTQLEVRPRRLRDLLNDRRVRSQTETKTKIRIVRRRSEDAAQH